MTKIDSSLLGKVPLSYFLGTLGMLGGREQARNNCVSKPSSTKTSPAKSGNCVS